MLIYPAIDLIDGTCVRLAQGRFDAITRYDDDPSSRLVSFASAGAGMVHIVDLDGARAGVPQQHALIGKIASEAGAAVQAAGGVRQGEHVQHLLAAGIERVVVGSLAVMKPALVQSWLETFRPDHITLSLDVNLVEAMPLVATHGWAESSGISLWDVLKPFNDVGLKHLLVTDISRDGMLAGPNTDLMKNILDRFPELALQASGGVGTLDDILALKKAGAAAAIIGRAIYEGRFTLEEAISAGA